jgi:hypothetical protein
MDDTTLTGRTWVAFGPTGAVGSVHATADGYSFKLLSDDAPHGAFDSLDAAKSALRAARPGVDDLEFREH